MKIRNLAIILPLAGGLTFGAAGCGDINTPAESPANADAASSTPEASHQPDVTESPTAKESKTAQAAVDSLNEFYSDGSKPELAEKFGEDMSASGIGQFIEDTIDANGEITAESAPSEEEIQELADSLIHVFEQNDEYFEHIDYSKLPGEDLMTLAFLSQMTMLGMQASHIEFPVEAVTMEGEEKASIDVNQATAKTPDGQDIEMIGNDESASMVYIDGQWKLSGQELLKTISG